MPAICVYPLRIVERIRIAENGQALIDDYVVTDPEALLAPWKATMRYRRTGWETSEWICENNRALDNFGDD